MDKMYRCCIFDIDGTLTTTKSGETFRQDADDWQWLPGRVQKLAELDGAGTLIAFASNQGGVAFSWSRFTASAITDEIAKMAAEVNAATWRTCFNVPNEKALAHFYHPNDPNRKPNPGMLLEIMTELGVSPEETLFVGDRPEDQGAAHNAGVDFAWANDYFAETSTREEQG